MTENRHAPVFKSSDGTFSDAFTTDQRSVEAAFDIIGDVHGCYRELISLLRTLGYTLPKNIDEISADTVSAPPGRGLIFVGDLVDRGPNSALALKIVMAFAAAGLALSVRGNHDDKLLRWFKGNKVSLNHGLDGTIADLSQCTVTERQNIEAFLDALPLFLWLDGGKLVVAHAGVLESMVTGSGAHYSENQIRRFCLYGDTEGERDATGLPVRYHWAAGYRGKTAIVYGHTPLAKLAWVNNTLCIDTGCCFGGALTALRWPERKMTSVPAEAEYTLRRRPFGHPPIRPQRVLR